MINNKDSINGKQKNTCITPELIVLIVKETEVKTTGLKEQVTSVGSICVS